MCWQKKRKILVISAMHFLLYEKFSKRRSDFRIVLENVEEVQIGPESLVPCMRFSEKKGGDWQKAFEHLRLIAEAYTEYDFERVAESLMRIAERLSSR